MPPNPRVFRVPFPGVAFALLLALGVTAPPSRAQNVSMTAEPCLGGYYKPQRWLPINIQLDNQGRTADVEVSAQLKDYSGEPTEYRLPVEQLPAPSRRHYTLYILPPLSYSSRPLEVELVQGRRVVGQQQINLRPLSDGDRVVAVLGNEQGTLNLISGMSVYSRRPVQGGYRYMPPGYYGGPGGVRPYGRTFGLKAQAQVAYLHPDECPDRLKGFDAVDVLVVGNVSARELSTAQREAISQWVQSGGTIVIAGGMGAQRLTDPFFRDLLPVRVSGTVTIPRLVGMQNFSLKQAPATGGFVIASAAPKPGSRIWATADGSRLPLVVEGRAGAGRVVFMAFDYAKPPVRVWEGAPEMWRKILAEAEAERSILAELDSPWYAGMGGARYGRWRVGNACHELSQMDPPKFAYIGLFLISYIIVLVPVNYFVLKQRDKKEYAWVTTPIIVLVFSLLAYLVGYGMKGGQVLLAKVGVVETASGSAVGAAHHYVGLFSPRKTSYDLAVQDPGATLAEWRDDTGAPAKPLSIIESEPFRVQDMHVDMWSMRILRVENAVPLGQGIQARLTSSGAGMAGNVTNRTPYDLDDCYVVSGSQSVRLGRLGRGETRVVPPISPQSWPNGLLPPSVKSTITGNTPLDRMKRAIVDPLASVNPGAQSVNHPILIGWVVQPLLKVTVNGRAAHEQNVTLFLVHLR